MLYCISQLLYTYSMPFIFFQEHHVREKFVKALEAEFPDSGLVFSIGKSFMNTSFIIYLNTRT